MKIVGYKYILFTVKPYLFSQPFGLSVFKGLTVQRFQGLRGGAQA